MAITTATFRHHPKITVPEFMRAGEWRDFSAAKSTAAKAVLFFEWCAVAVYLREDTRGSDYAGGADFYLYGVCVEDADLEYDCATVIETNDYAQISEFCEKFAALPFINGGVYEGGPPRGSLTPRTTEVP